MLKYIVGFALFAGLALWVLFKTDGQIDLGGEKHEVNSHAPADAKKH